MTSVYFKTLLEIKSKTENYFSTPKLHFFPQYDFNR